MTAADRARGLVDALSRRAFVDVVAGFDDTMRAAISVAGLEQIWDTTLIQVGPLAECTGTQAGQQGAHCIVEVNCRFANAMLVVRVAYECECAAAMIGARAPVRIDCRRSIAGRFMLFDVNLKPNITGPGRPVREGEESLVSLAGRAAGWSYAELLRNLLRQAWPA